MFPTRHLAVAAALTFASTSASAVVIDSFEDGDFELTVGEEASPVQSVATTFGAAGNIIGGKRIAELNLKSGRGVVDARLLGAAMGVGPVGDPNSNGVLAVSDSARAFSQFILDYRDLGGVDLTDGGRDDAIAVNFDFLQGVSRIAVRAVGGGADATVAKFAYDSDNDLAAAASATVQQVLFNFSDPNYAAAGVDFSAVDRLVFYFDSNDNQTGGATDFEIDSIVTVPEPASIVLLAGGLGLLASRRRRTA